MIRWDLSTRALLKVGAMEFGTDEQVAIAFTVPLSPSRRIKYPANPSAPRRPAICQKS